MTTTTMMMMILIFIRLESRLLLNIGFTLRRVLAFLDFWPPWLCNDYRSPEIHYQMIPLRDV